MLIDRKMPVVSFKTRRGKKVSFKTRAKGSRRSPRKAGAFAKLVKKMSRETGKSGPALFKAAAKQHKKMQ